MPYQPKPTFWISHEVDLNTLWFLLCFPWNSSLLIISRPGLLLCLCLVSYHMEFVFWYFTKVMLDTFLKWKVTAGNHSCVYNFRFVSCKCCWIFQITLCCDPHDPVFISKIHISFCSYVITCGSSAVNMTFGPQTSKFGRRAIAFEYLLVIRHEKWHGPFTSGMFLNDK